MYDEALHPRPHFGPPTQEEKKEAPGPGGEGQGGAPGGYRPVKPRGPLGGPPCADPGPLHNNASMTQTVQNTVPWPEPYKTLDDENSYAPGHNDITKRYSALKSIVKGGVRL